MSVKKVIAIAGAYVAWIMGSGFATGQEIFQFFTSYGSKSYLLILINLAGFLIVGNAVMTSGQAHRQDPDYDPFIYFCGSKIGTLYKYILPVSMFAGMSILVSGAGTVLQEYYGLNHYIGALVLILLSYLAYVVGFERFLRTVSCIGPVIIVFMLIVGVLSIAFGMANIEAGTTPFAEQFMRQIDVSSHSQALEAIHPSRYWWFSGLLYIAYNLCDGTQYYTALGAQSSSKKEVLAGGILGSLAFIAAIFVLNTSMLMEMDQVIDLGIPTLYLAQKISPVLGFSFCFILFGGIFSACSAIMWTICDRFVVQGTKKSHYLAAGIGIAAFLLGLLPFSSLIGVIYTISGYIGLFFVIRVTVKTLFKK